MLGIHLSFSWRFKLWNPFNTHHLIAWCAFNWYLSQFSRLKMLPKNCPSSPVFTILFIVDSCSNESTAPVYPYLVSPKLNKSYRCVFLTKHIIVWSSSETCETDSTQEGYSRVNSLSYCNTQRKGALLKIIQHNETYWTVRPVRDRNIGASAFSNINCTF